MLKKKVKAFLVIVIFDSLVFSICTAGNNGSSSCSANQKKGSNVRNLVLKGSSAIGVGAFLWYIFKNRAYPKAASSAQTNSTNTSLLTSSVSTSNKNPIELPSYSSTDVNLFDYYSLFTNEKEHVFTMNPGCYSKTRITCDLFSSKLESFLSEAKNKLNLGDKFTHYVQKIVVPSGSEISFIGDIHGSFHSLIRDILRLQSLGYLSKDLKIINSNFYMVFLGDYIDRGTFGIEVLFTLISLKMMNWDRVFLLRGNHESDEISSQFGFLDEVKKRFSPNKKELFDNLWSKIVTFYSALPLALYIGSGSDTSWIQCSHGGIQTGFNPSDFLKNNDVVMDVSNAVVKSSRPNMPGFLWTDFINGDESCIDSSRGYLITVNDAKKYFDTCGIRAIFRGHQHSECGLKIGGIDSTEISKSHWVNFVEHGGKYIQIANISQPIFTFSTAAEGVKLPCDCFGILKTADTYDKWILTPYESQLPGQCERNNKFVHVIADASGGMPKFEWHDDKQVIM